MPPRYVSPSVPRRAEGILGLVSSLSETLTIPFAFGTKWEGGRIAMLAPGTYRLGPSVCRPTVRCWCATARPFRCAEITADASRARRDAGQGVRKEELARHATAARRPCACRHFERRNYHVVTIEELTRSLKAASTWSQRRKIEHELVRLDPGVAFHLLYSIATTYGVDTPHDAAASILLQLQPRCPLSCEDALRFLARTNWNLSDHLIPFYLVTQFGQQRVVQAVRLVKTEFDNESQARVTGVGYWAEKPAVLLIEDFVALEHRARKEDAKTRRSE